MGETAIHVCHLFDRRKQQCQWTEPDGRRCPATFETSAKNRMYCDMHQHDNKLRQANAWNHKRQEQRRAGTQPEDRPPGRPKGSRSQKAAYLDEVAAEMREKYKKKKARQPTQLHPIRPTAPRLTEIRRLVAEAFGISWRGLLQPSKLPEIRVPRQIAIYFCRQHTGHTLTTIGRAFHQHPSTIAHSVRQGRALAERVDLQPIISRIRESLADPKNLQSISLRSLATRLDAITGKLDQLLDQRQKGAVA